MAECTEWEQRLVAAAREARQRAYAPYSRYAVGAALGTAQQRIHVGCNVENASYGLTICAERTAVVSAVAAGDRDFDLLAVVTENGGLPCGACLQVLAEFCTDLPLLIVREEDGIHIVRQQLSQLLPLRFRSNRLDAAALEGRQGSQDDE